MKRHFFWIAELFIWLLILVMISGGIMLARYNYRMKFNSYQIFMPDIDGIISGSPVRLMGIDVGYVSQVNIVGDDVYVKFIITNEEVKLPHGTIATIEFSGLGGSKSLELYPPTGKNKTVSDSFIVVQPPKRIGDSFGLLNSMFEDIGELAYRVSSFMDKVGIIQVSDSIEEKSVKRERFSAKILIESNNWLDKTRKACDNFNDKLKGLKNGSRKNN